MAGDEAGLGHQPVHRLGDLLDRADPCQRRARQQRLAGEIILALFRPQDRAGGHRIDPHLRRQLQRQRTGGHLQRGLGHGVGDVVTHRIGAVQVGQVDDAALLAAQVGRGCL
ncbi:hypothetical protein G6F23_015458 [Rhizopus arrhizus]|nr:hypothetical protein G6F23_015458 [Rhizopus arrhizus]